jgi:predicted MFS family arabinose efflux permease
VSARTWIAVALAAASAGVAQGFGRFTLGVVLPAIRADLGLSNTIAGSLATANVGAYLVGTLAVAIAAPRIRMLTIMRIGLLIAVGGLALAAVSPNAPILAAAMFLSGFGGAWVWIPTPVIASDAFPPEKRGTVIALLSSGMGLSIVFASQLAAWVRGISGDEGWRTVYLIQAVIGVVTALTTIAVVRHSQGQLSAKGGIGGFDALRRVPGWKPVTMMYTTFGFMYLLVLAFLTSRLEDDNGWSSNDASLAFTLVGVAMIFGGPIMAKAITIFGMRASLASAFALWSLVVITILPGWFLPTLTSATFLGLIFASIPVTLTMYFVQNAAPEDYGPGFSAATLAFGVAQMVSPQIGGAVADWTSTFTWVLVLSAGCATVGIFGALGLPKSGSRDPQGPLPVPRYQPLVAASVFSIRPR